MLLHLSKLPTVTVDGLPCKENGRTYWESIPEFSYWLSEHALHVHAIEDIDLGNCPLTWHQQAQQYKKANSFAAVYTSALSPFITHEWKSMQYKALGCLSQALEVEVLTHLQIRRAGLCIPAATAWLLHAAPRIFEFCKSRELYQGVVEQRPWIGGSDGGKCLWKGDDGFGIERWMFWKQRFEVIGGLRRRGFAGRVVDDIVRCSRLAVKTMARVEQGDSYALDAMSVLFKHDDDTMGSQMVDTKDGRVLDATRGFGCGRFSEHGEAFRRLAM
ncbi:hypothetical protein E4T45_02591 [Aureobasidium sp. EXF-8846]|nr:hypothetical protein E4T45_02591 [Aureobasidium sp. EXF-8846]